MRVHTMFYSYSKFSLLCCAALLLSFDSVEGRGFGGGGGRSLGGGGGMSRPAPSRPSTPSLSRPAPSRPSTLPMTRPTPSRPSTPSINRPTPSRPSSPSVNRPPTTRPSSPTTRPSSPTSRPEIDRPQLRPGIQPGNRPGLEPGNRPSIQPGNRPNIDIGDRPGNRPGPTRPGIDTGRPGIGGDRPGITRPGIDTGRPLPGRPSQLPSRPGIGDRPGIGERPSTLPGLGIGTRPGLGERPGFGDRPERPVTRPSFDDRKTNISDRLDQRGDLIDDRMANRSDRWKDRQDNWDQWYDRHYYHHHHWHHGHWYGHYYPGSRWNYWWDNYPVLTTFGVTTWAINRVSWAFGYSSYYNPYATGTYIDNSTVVYDYSQPIVMTPDEQSLADDPTEPPETSEVSDVALSDFDKARVSFFDGNYSEALKQTDAALKKLPNDTVIHEFRALVTFAQGDYAASAATLYAVLSVGPGWDWTTMSGLYPSVDIYTEHLRALEDFCRKNPDNQSARFVLAYHYVTAGHDDAAIKQLTGLVKANPKDEVSKQMLLRLNPDAEIPSLPEPVEPPVPNAPVPPEELQGSWQASREGNQFNMTLKENQEFIWKYSSGDQVQEVRGVWGVDEQGVLALEMNDGGVMLAQTIVDGNELNFYMLGDTQGTAPLAFKKQPG